MTNPFTCKNCGKPIVLADKPGGGKMGLDAKPHPRGCVVVDAFGRVGPKRPGDRPDLSLRYMPHYLTCQGRVGAAPSAIARSSATSRQFEP
jgi:hypothetical protein